MTGCACGCGCGGTGDGICPCEGITGPWWPYNPSGLSQLSYRVGDFQSFRHALVLHQPGEQALAAWRPTADGDLGLQVIDWFSIVADILSFYNERIANEAYLDTAQLLGSVQRLVGLLGYRPKPGIGAVATLAVLAARPAPAILPDRFAISSKAQPGLPSQTFELTTGTTFSAPTSVATPPPQETTSLPPTDGPPPGSAPGAAEPPAVQAVIAHGGVLVQGKPSKVNVGDWLLLHANPWTSVNDTARWVRVTGMVLEPDPHGRPNTRVLLNDTSALSGSAAGYALMRPVHSSHLITIPSGSTPLVGDPNQAGETDIYLESTARWLTAGDPLVVSSPQVGSAGTCVIAQLAAYSELLWYANGSGKIPTTAPSTNPIPLMIAELVVTTPTGATLVSSYEGQIDTVTVQSGWTSVGTLLDTAVTQVSTLSKLTLARPPAAPAGLATPAIVEDSLGQGASVTATPASGSADVSVALAGQTIAAGTLAPPLQLLWDLITVTRGQSVLGEQLGIGDATQAGQDFTLQRSPVTYLADGSPGSPGPSLSGDGYSSTITLIVDGIYWTEVPMLYGQAPDALVFSTYEDAGGQTHVVTGDGAAGARLQTGAVVTANYRIGSGVAVPPATSLTQIVTPATNVSGVRNPVAAAGGATRPARAADHLRAAVGTDLRPRGFGRRLCDRRVAGARRDPRGGRLGLGRRGAAVARQGLRRRRCGCGRRRAHGALAAGRSEPPDRRRRCPTDRRVAEPDAGDRPVVRRRRRRHRGAERAARRPVRTRCAGDLRAPLPQPDRGDVSDARGARGAQPEDVVDGADRNRVLRGAEAPRQLRRSALRPR